jgi:hypothetical protein
VCGKTREIYNCTCGWHGYDSDEESQLEFRKISKEISIGSCPECGSESLFPKPKKMTSKYKEVAAVHVFRRN